MNLEWPAEHATRRAWLITILVGILAAEVALLVHMQFPGILGDPVELLLMFIVAMILVPPILDGLALIWNDLRDPDRLALSRAARAIAHGDDPRRVADGLSRLPLDGRPRLRRDVAVRCLLLSGRLRRLDLLLRREAARWLIEARKEMKE